MCIACLLIRELDGLFDLISHGFWVYPAAIVAASSIIYALKQKQQTIETFCLFVQSHNFISMCLGMGVLFVFSRLFCMGSLWDGLMQAHPERAVKNVAEEGTEMLGYMVIFFSCVSYLVDFSHQEVGEKLSQLQTHHHN
ncbi:hypothetical protein HC723_07745 [Vibrio sp. S11_S32]|uniref:hypothetical protein n=1 Tax=Vibrio sp. S11_S32 TaxID=2720225 RepID=UPI001680BFE3|nr:hypothetical protein [Vibrio sp. S11_S32]MBD1576327.1 hypothetical protein [Vibrio sp. S11_S32]